MKVVKDQIFSSGVPLVLLNFFFFNSWKLIGVSALEFMGFDLFGVLDFGFTPC